LRRIATEVHPMLRQPFSALTETCAKFEVGQPISCCRISFLLLIPYFTLWPWPLTL